MGTILDERADSWENAEALKYIKYQRVEGSGLSLPHCEGNKKPRALLWENISGNVAKNCFARTELFCVKMGQLTHLVGNSRQHNLDTCTRTK